MTFSGTRLSKHFIEEIIEAGGVVNCTQMPEMEHSNHSANRLYEAWRAQIHRLHINGQYGVTKPREFNADVCDLMLACDFFNFYVTAQDYERPLLLSTYLKPEASDKVAEHWRIREKCCSTFTDLNIKFGMLSHARGLYYIGLFCFGIVINTRWFYKNVTHM